MPARTALCSYIGEAIIVTRCPRSNSLRPSQMNGKTLPDVPKGRRRMWLIKLKQGFSIRPVVFRWISGFCAEVDVQAAADGKMVEVSSKRNSS